MLLAISASLRFVSVRLADGAFHLQLGGSTVLHGDALADGEFAVLVGNPYSRKVETLSR